MTIRIIGMDTEGTITLRKRLSRAQLMKATTNLPVCLIAMEASCGAHHIGRMLAAQGHDVRLIPAQFVRPFVKSNKNDYIDADLSVCSESQAPG